MGNFLIIFGFILGAVIVIVPLVVGPIVLMKIAKKKSNKIQNQQGK